MPEITCLSQLDPNGRYTYQDYLTWKFKERVELFRGVIAKIYPAPNRRHQSTSGNIFFDLKLYLKNSSRKVYDAPFVVLLSKEDQSTVVQPDICVICDEDKLTEQGCTGAPDLIVEVLSPGNSSREMKDKFVLYEENGVKEYWLVSPMQQSIIRYNLDGVGKYIGSRHYVPGEEFSSKVINGFSVQVDEVFKE